MNQSREEADALRRIEELLSQQQDAQPPDAATANAERVVDPPVDPEAIQQAEQQANAPENIGQTTNAVLEQILAELQVVSNLLQELTG